MPDTTTATPLPSPSPDKPMRVAVLVELYRHADAGGHVKCWERLAEAAASAPSPVDLTVYFLGRAAATEALSAQVRYRMLPPRRPTDASPLLRQGAGDTDLAAFHPMLARELADADIIHVTSQFSFARTGVKVARQRGTPLVFSSHTDVPYLTRVYTGEIVERLLGQGWLSRLLLGRFRLADRMAARAQRRLEQIITASRRVIMSSPQDVERVAAIVPRARLSVLRRGINLARFSTPQRREDWLTERFGVPPGRPVVLFAGRVDESKRILTVADAVGQLIDDDVPCHLLVIGEGHAAAAVKQRLGAHATLPGRLPQAELAEVYANADVFAFPSESETAGNVVLEAKVAGLPVLLSAHGNTTQFLHRHGEDGLAIEDRSAASFAAALKPLLTDPVLRGRMAAAARAAAVRDAPTWRMVLEQDLVPVWRAVLEHDAIRWSRLRDPSGRITCSKH